MRPHRLNRKRTIALAFCLILIGLSACGSPLRECQLYEAPVEQTGFNFVNFNLILSGNGSTTGAVYDATGRGGLAYAPDFRTQKTFTNTGGSYIQQAYTNLEPGTYRIRVQGARESAEREMTFQNGRAYQLQAECP